MEELRIQKYLSDCGVMSRRAAEREIETGKIFINGIQAKLGQKIIPTVDVVEYNGNIIKKVQFDTRIYIMLNKPRGYVTTLSDEKNRSCIVELISDIDTRVYPIGRLDMDSEGLLLLTNDGDLTNKLTHPRHNIAKIYHIKISSKITPEELKALNSTMKIDDYDILPVKTKIVSLKEGYSILEMELHEGRNRQIRKMCESLNLNIIRLQRIAIGNLMLGDLKPGKWRHLTKSQVNYLKQC